MPTGSICRALTYVWTTWIPEDIKETPLQEPIRCPSTTTSNKVVQDSSFRQPLTVNLMRKLSAADHTKRNPKLKKKKTAPQQTPNPSTPIKGRHRAIHTKRCHLLNHFCYTKLLANIYTTCFLQVFQCLLFHEVNTEAVAWNETWVFSSHCD